MLGKSGPQGAKTNQQAHFEAALTPSRTSFQAHFLSFWTLPPALWPPWTVGPRALLHPRSLSQACLVGPCPPLHYRLSGRDLCCFICSHFHPFRKCSAPRALSLSFSLYQGLSSSRSTQLCLDILQIYLAALISRVVAQLTGLLIRLEKLRPKGVMVGRKELIPSMVSTRSNWQLALGRVRTPRWVASSGHDGLKNWNGLGATVSRTWTLAFAPVEKRQDQEKMKQGPTGGKRDAPSVHGRRRGMKPRVCRKLCLPQAPEEWNGQVCLVSQPWAPAALLMTFSSYNSPIVSLHLAMAWVATQGLSPGTSRDREKQL